VTWLLFDKSRLKSILIRDKTGGKSLPRRKLLDSLIKKYGTNKEYTAIFLDHILTHYKDNPRYEVYLDAELGALKRSRELIKSLSQKFENDHLFRGKDCLDIGSSAGNSLIAFVENGAARATGIEICEGRYQTASINVNGCKDEIRGKIQMLREDIQNEEINGIGQFDIIFCTDVLEHVQEPRQTIKQICRLLKNSPEAFAYIRLRNFQHPENVIHEPHYDFPGMVLLPEELSKAYYECCKPSDPIDYEALHWRSFYDYQTMFKSFGKKCTLFDKINPEASCIVYVEDEIKKLLLAFDEFSEKHSLDRSLKKEIDKYIDAYRTRIETSIHEYRSAEDRLLLEMFYVNFVVYDLVMLVTNEM
jgi:2-polyprenyl-3-methyl-5-hydroxy-6-metoxy-1,4-benzoquinol methylase